MTDRMATRRGGWRLAMVVALAALLAGTGASAGEPDNNRRWDWQPAELGRIRQLTKQVKTEKNKEGDWHYLDTDHFSFRVEIDARFTAELAVFMELYYEQFIEGFPSPAGRTASTTPDGRFKIIFVVYDSPAKYVANGGPVGSRGCYLSSRRRIITYMAGRNVTFAQCYRPVIQHEAAHAVLHGLSGFARPVPVWFTEAIANYYERWDFRGTGRPAGRDAASDAGRRQRNHTSTARFQLRAYLKANNNFFPRLGELVNLDTSRQWNPDGFGPVTAKNYLFAEIFADFLFSDKEGRELLPVIYGRMLDAKIAPNRVDGQPVLDRPLLTEVEIARLEPRWYEHMRREWNNQGRAPK